MPTRVAFRPCARLLLDRRLTLVTTSLLAASLLAMLAVPQRVTGDVATASAFVRLLSLDAVVASWWFRVLVAVASLQLMAVTVKVARRDVRRFLRTRGPASREGFDVREPRVLARALRVNGYLRIRRTATTARYIKHPWGYAGPTLLHGGMLLAACGVLAVALTQSAGLLQLVEGQSVPAGTALQDPRQGPLGSEPSLEENLTLERIDASFWENGEPRSFTGVLALESASGVTRLAVTTNQPRTVRGVRYYQEQRVGYVFFVTISRGSDVLKQRIELLQPPSAIEASYAEYTLSDGSLLRTKCLVDEVSGGQPTLVFRLVRDGKTVAEESMVGGATAKLADMTVSVDAVARWAVITIERSYGHGLLFSSFFIIFLGAMLIYGAPPREITLVRDERGIRAEWYATRFTTAFAGERERLRSAAAGEDVRT